MYESKHVQSYVVRMGLPEMRSLHKHQSPIRCFTDNSSAEPGVEVPVRPFFGEDVPHITRAMMTCVLWVFFLYFFLHCCCFTACPLSMIRSHARSILQNERMSRHSPCDPWFPLTTSPFVPEKTLAIKRTPATPFRNRNPALMQQELCFCFHFSNERNCNRSDRLRCIQITWWIDGQMNGFRSKKQADRCTYR